MFTVILRRSCTGPGFLHETVVVKNVKQHRWNPAEPAPMTVNLVNEEDVVLISPAQQQPSSYDPQTLTTILRACYQA